MAQASLGLNHRDTGISYVGIYENLNTYVLCHILSTARNLYVDRRTVIHAFRPGKAPFISVDDRHYIVDQQR